MVTLWSSCLVEYAVICSGTHCFPSGMEDLGWMEKPVHACTPLLLSSPVQPSGVDRLLAMAIVLHAENALLALCRIKMSRAFLQASVGYATIRWPPAGFWDWTQSCVSRVFSTPSHLAPLPPSSFSSSEAQFYLPLKASLKYWHLYGVSFGCTKGGNPSLP